MSDLSQESKMWREWSEAAASVKQMRAQIAELEQTESMKIMQLEMRVVNADARIAELVDLLTECRDCVASDINYTTAQSWHQPATVDYLDALLARVDVAIKRESGDAG